MLSTQDAAKFSRSTATMTRNSQKLNDQRIQRLLKEYAQWYNQMTDAKADELIQKSLAYQKQRSELLVPEP